MKRVFIRIISLVFAVVFISVVPVSADTPITFSYRPDSSPSGFVVSYYKGINSRGFTWQTSVDVSETVVEIVCTEADGSVDFSKATKIYGTVKTVNSGSGTSNIHSVAVENLKQGKTYAYRAGGDGEFVTGRFTVYDGRKSVNIITFSDPRTRNPALAGIWKSTAKSALSVVSEPDLIAISGDISDKTMYDSSVDVSSTSSNYYRIADALERGNFGSVPVAVASGENDGKTAGLYEAAGYTDRDFGVTNRTYTDVPTSGGSYFIEYGDDALVLIADSTRLTMNNEILRLTDILSRSNHKWKIVVIHRGPFSSGCEDKTEALIRKKTADMFSKYHVDLVITGHDLAYCKTQPYAWDNASTTSFYASSDYETKKIGDRKYDICPDGTYYVSLGAAGHLYSEGKSAFADPDGANYSSHKLTLVGTNSLTGEPSSAAMNCGMFGTLKIDGNKLEYDIYKSTGEKAELYDTLSVYKSKIINSDKTEIELSDGVSDEEKENAIDLIKEYSGLSHEEKIFLGDEIENVIKEARNNPDIVRGIEKERFEGLRLCSDGISNVILAGVQDTVDESGKFGVRFIAAVGGGDIDACGFKITAKYGNTLKTFGGYAEELLHEAATGNGIITSYSSDDMECRCLFSLTVTDVPISTENVIFSVEPFIIRDGKPEYGTGLEITYSDGYFYNYCGLGQ